MPGGPFDSSKTRVGPVFDRVANERDWVRRLLRLAKYAARGEALADAIDLAPTSRSWAPSERGLSPPRSLLRWIVENATALVGDTTDQAKRASLIAGDLGVRDEAFAAIDAGPADRGWYVFEGTTYPDAVVETPDAIIVVEGKRTESGPTITTPR